MNPRSDFYLLAVAHERKRIRRIALNKAKTLRESAVDENGMTKRERKMAKRAARRAVNDATVGADGLSVSARNRRDRLARKQVRNSVVGEDGLTGRQRSQELRIARRRRKVLVRAATMELKDTVVVEGWTTRAEKKVQIPNVGMERMQ